MKNRIVENFSKWNKLNEESNKILWKGKSVRGLESIFFASSNIISAIEDYNRLKDGEYYIKEVDVIEKDTSGFELNHEYVVLDISYYKKDMTLFDNNDLKTKQFNFNIDYTEDDFDGTDNGNIVVYLNCDNSRPAEGYLGSFNLDAGGYEITKAVRKQITVWLQRKLK